jgi:hypothetical protein
MLEQPFKIKILFAITFQLTGGRSKYICLHIETIPKISLIFSPPCRMFTPILADFYRVKFGQEILPSYYYFIDLRANNTILFSL